MEFHQNLPTIDDARDFFLLAKERLLDVNDWQGFISNSSIKIRLTDEAKQHQSRPARMGDVIYIAEENATSSWIGIRKIQYDFFPDIRSESVSMLLESTDGHTETIMIQRKLTTVTAHCNIGNELPAYDATSPEEQINTNTDRHPVFNISKTHLHHLITEFINIDNT